MVQTSLKNKASLLHGMKRNYVEYAKYACFLFVVVFFALVVFLMSVTSLGYLEVITKFPVLTVGFVVSTLQMYIGFNLNSISKEAKEGKQTSEHMAQLCIYAITQASLFNYPSSICMALGIYKIHKTSALNMKCAFKQSIKSIKTWMTIGICLCCILISFWFLYAFA